MDSNDRFVVRDLAKRWVELANLPVMEERKRLWTLEKDLRAERPMVLFETWTLERYVDTSELVCQDAACRGLERHMRHVIRHVEEVGDDIVVEPVWKMGWHVSGPDYGVTIPRTHATDHVGGTTGYSYEHPIQTPADVDRLKPRSWTVDREGSRAAHERIADLIGDIMPVTLHGIRGFHSPLTQDLFKLVGNANLMVWVFDEPEAIHRIMSYLRDDRVAYHEFLELEGLLGLNNDSTLVGSGSPGFTTVLPQSGYNGTARLRDLWIWAESQETAGISPAMFDEFFLPYIADVAAQFGLIYYGCCEPVSDRWDMIIRAIPHVRAVSISPWCDMELIGQKLGKTCVFARKPKPWLISGYTPDWDGLRKDIQETLSASRDCNTELVFRDVYRIEGDRPRLARWAAMVREEIDRRL
ncbi:hypothetical protein FJZ36_02680 [Candidatus Poribacteria bacterium]|nr:hypothetical protein [Candidatus Poribacteria bacterium]